MSAKWPPKDPDETLDYGFDWAPRSIGTDLITAITATIVAPAQTLSVASTRVATNAEVDAYNQAVAIYNLTATAKRSGAHYGQMTVTWLTGGTVGQVATVQLHAITDGGRILDQAVTITIAERV